MYDEKVFMDALGVDFRYSQEKTHDNSIFHTIKTANWTLFFEEYPEGYTVASLYLDGRFQGYDAENDKEVLDYFSNIIRTL